MPTIGKLFYHEFTWFSPVDKTRTYLVSTLMIALSVLWLSNKTSFNISVSPHQTLPPFRARGRRSFLTKQKLRTAQVL
ncbi:hypothetical protein CARUB_v10006159mg [Capsella rubella]|uniref:Uncharacterized protein n=1 Tax=Capsella rubella TaxID=81985 RepID=R0F824_9BRAS|nr:hypothetical protein CARUB_v10006159mg [Capsella rubella]EOA17771.1 hypothetical protein CARUB_v10006159mg [Capsella rubella]